MSESASRYFPSIAASITPRTALSVLAGFPAYATVLLAQNLLVLPNTSSSYTSSPPLEHQRASSLTQPRHHLQALLPMPSPPPLSKNRSIHSCKFSH